jgi:nucleoside-diphosphate-sugar epimerase
MESETLLNDNVHVYNVLSGKTDRIKGSTFLITGSKGFLGRTIISFLNYLNLEKFSAEEKVTIHAVDYDDHDICQPLHDVIPAGKIDYIFNCAGIASPKKYLRAPVKTLDVSYLGTKNVFDLAIARGTESIIMYSSSEVYGTPAPEDIPTLETVNGSVPTFGNRSCYDIGKNVLESLSYVYYNKFDIPVNVLRPFNLYGPLMDINDGRIVPNICKAMLEEKDFSIYGNGKQTRTYCYVADAMVYMFAILLSEKFGEIYNIGSEDEELTATGLAEVTYDFMKPENSRAIVTEYPEDYPNQEPRRRCPNITKVKKLSGYSPQYSLIKGFKSCYDYFKSEYY